VVLSWLGLAFPESLGVNWRPCMTDENDSHSENHHSPKISTDVRLIISTNPVSRKTPFLIGDNLNANSKVTEESHRYPEEHLLFKWI
jgi:hypothetical protein